MWRGKRRRVAVGVKGAVKVLRRREHATLHVDVRTAEALKCIANAKRIPLHAVVEEVCLPLPKMARATTPCRIEMRCDSGG